MLLGRSPPHSMREDPENIYVLLFRFLGNVQRGLAFDAEVCRSRARSHRLRGRCCSAWTSFVTAVKTHHTKPIRGYARVLGACPFAPTTFVRYSSRLIAGSAPNQRGHVVTVAPLSTTISKISTYCNRKDPLAQPRTSS